MSNHLLIITPGFAIDESDSACLTYLQNYLLKFRNKQPQTKVTILALQYPHVTESYQWHGITVHVLNGDGQTKKLGLLRKAIRITAQIHGKHPIDAIHSLWLGKTAFLGFLLSKRHRTSHTCTLMGQEIRPSRKNIYLSILPLKKIHMVSVSKFQDNLFKKRSNAPTHVIPWGADPPPTQSKQKRDIDILAVGYLNEVKSPTFFIEVIAAIREEMPGIRCSMIGQDYSNGLWRKRIQELDLSDHIQIAGRLDNKEVLNMMQRSKVLLHTSTYESQGYVFSEALSCGMQIVSRKVGSAHDAPYWHIVDQEGDFAQLTLKALQKYESNFHILNTLDDTVERYRALYQLRL